MVDITQSLTEGKKILEKKLADIKVLVGYGETAYHLPVSYSLTGKEVNSGEDAEIAYKATSDSLLVATEAIVAAGSVAGSTADNSIYTGFIGDSVIRKLGYSLVDGSILGLALIAGKASEAGIVSGIARELQEKLLLTFLAGDIAKGLDNEGVKIGLGYRLVPLGPDTLSGIHFVDILARVAMMFGGVAPGDPSRLLRYAEERAKAFVIALPGLSPEEIAFIDALRPLGIPILYYKGYEGENWIRASPENIVQKGMELRGIKVMVTAIPIPMACSPAFEGKSIRREEMYVEFGGGKKEAFELLTMKPKEEVIDGKVTVIGPEISQLKEGSASSLAIIIEVAGEQMKKDFEPVLERRIHNFVNYGEGSWHVAQRDLIWVRLTKEAVLKGLKIEHIGKLLALKFKMDFPSLIDAVQVTLITDEPKVILEKKEAEKIYMERDERVAGMKDTDVQLFYSCTLCQTFAPNHVCIITPERSALCGAISWLDGKTAYEISPSGANQPVQKGAVIDALKGEFEEVNRFVRKASHGEIDRCSLYSIMEYPMTCCGCFECIALILPEVNGIMVVNRDYKGETPSGMSFSTLAGTIGGGAQTPGFMGISKGYILSDRFLQSEGGIKRLVWIPQILKDELGKRLIDKLEQLGISSFYNKISTDKNATTIEDLILFLEKEEHPALSMPPLIGG